MTDPKDKNASGAGHGVQLPPETVKRWRDIVASSVKAGRDISVLVQQYAEQSFNAKLASLDHQGVRRRMLARAHTAVDKELARADAHLKAEPASQPAFLARLYNAQRIDVPSAEAAAPPATRRSEDSELHHTVTALPDPLRKRPELEAHVAQLSAQLVQIDAELPRIDSILNRGLKNQQAVVQELSAVSKELYRLAQEVVAELPGVAPRPEAAAPPPPKKSKLMKHLPPVAEAPSAPTPAAADAGADPEVQRTVPINPLALGVRKLRQDLAKPMEALLHQVDVSQKAAVHGIASASASVGRTLKPVGSALSTATHQVTQTSATFLGRLLAALGAAWSGLFQKAKDAWPWRGPAPPEP